MDLSHILLSHDSPAYLRTVLPYIPLCGRLVRPRGRSWTCCSWPLLWGRAILQDFWQDFWNRVHDVGWSLLQCWRILQGFITLSKSISIITTLKWSLTSGWFVLFVNNTFASRVIGSFVTQQTWEDGDEVMIPSIFHNITCPEKQKWCHPITDAVLMAIKTH